MGIYSRNSFNKYGDLYIYREHQASVDDLETFAPVVDSSEIETLNYWNRYLSERGSYLVVAGYTIYYDKLPVDDEYTESYQSSLEQQLDCSVISYWSDYTYPAS